MIALGNGAADIAAALLESGPLILSHFCKGFPYGSKYTPYTDPTVKHAVVINAITMTDGYNGNCFINNPWDDVVMPVPCNAVLRAISKMQGQGLKPIAYYR